MEIISKENARIENFLSRETGAPKNLFLKLIRKKKIKINGQICKIGNKVLIGDKITTEKEIIYKQEDHLNIFYPLSYYESENFIIINKPYGISSQKGKGIKISLDEIMFNLAIKNNYKSFITHRLDKNTTGTMLFSKELNFTQKIGKMFQHNLVNKIYVAIIEGHLPKEIEAKFSLEDKDAISVFIPILYLKSQTLCMVFMKFGRKHQIRIHASILGYPLYADKYYGTGNGNFFLHCFSLSFLEFTFFAQLPKLFYKYVNENSVEKKISFLFLLKIYYKNLNRKIFTE